MRYPIYEALPALYMIAGAAAATGIEEIYGRISGVLLLASGLVIRYLRTQYRKASLVEVNTISSRW